jgi:hypothetical protein
MKTFWDLTKDEIVGLTSDQIARYIDIDCAEQGVSLLPDLPPAPIYEKPAKDCVVYSVDNFDVSTPEEANVILDALGKVRLLKLDYDYGNYSDQYISDTRNVDVPDVKKVQVYSAKLYNSIRNDLKSYSEKKNAYEREQKEYSKILSERSRISDAIWNKYNEVTEEFQNREYMKKEFAKYLDLADGDKEIAMRFFDKAYADKLEGMEGLEEFKSSLLV